MLIVTHTIVLYGAVLLALLAAALTFRGRDDPDLSGWEVARTMWPFLAIATVEALDLGLRGRLMAEWALPLLAALVVTACSRSLAVVRRARLLLLLAALVLWTSGQYLIHHDYTRDPRFVPRGGHIEAGWERPVLGYWRIVRR